MRRRGFRVRSDRDVARYRRRMVVLIVVATAMVCVKLVAMSWKGAASAGPNVAKQVIGASPRLRDARPTRRSIAPAVLPRSP